jgi:CcmD family protein
MRLRAQRSWLRVLFLVVLLCGTGASMAATIQQQPPANPAQEGFVPVDQVQSQDQIPAAPLVMAAYAVAWVAIFVYVWSIWRRLGKVEQEIADLSRRVASGVRK